MFSIRILGFLYWLSLSEASTKYACSLSGRVREWGVHTYSFSWHTLSSLTYRKLLHQEYNLFFIVSFDTLVMFLKNKIELIIWDLSERIMKLLIREYNIFIDSHKSGPSHIHIVHFYWEYPAIPHLEIFKYISKFKSGTCEVLTQKTTVLLVHVELPCFRYGTLYSAKVFEPTIRNKISTYKSNPCVDHYSTFT